MNRTLKILGFTLLLIAIVVMTIALAEIIPMLLASVGWHDIASVGWVKKSM